MRWRWRLVAVYLVLLAASHVVRLTSPPPAPAPESRTLTVPAVKDGEALDERTVTLAYREWGSRDAGPAIVLLHGSPGAAADFSAMADELGSRAWVIAPDLPGFGDSTQSIPDYSIRAHARYVETLLDRLEIDRAHLVGFSLGGGVALHVADDIPERVSSLILLSAVGVQELELLGDRNLNRALHGFQLLGLFLLEEAVPHFGLFDRSMLNVSYARNFFDTDQRPLRGILESWDGPAMVLHGDKDILVPYAAAEESYRLMPQSELITFEGANHFLVFTRPSDLVEPIASFVTTVEAGRARTRDQAPAERVTASKADVSLPTVQGMAIVIWVILLAAATLVSEDLTCIASGLLVAQGRIDFIWAVVGCSLGIFVGDMLLFSVGRVLGRPWLYRPPFSWLLSDDDIERSTYWFQQRGPMVVFISRFVPGSRMPVYITAGLMRLNPFKFAFYLMAPTIVWTPMLVGLAQAFGERVLSGFETFAKYAIPGAIGIALLIYIVLTLARGFATHRGRRRLRGKWIRMSRWEYWPRWIFYPPVLLWAIVQMIRFRSITVFTAANPGMNAGGGFVGESKAQILDRLDPAKVAPFELLPIEESERETRLDAFIEEHGLPMVLKPNAGQRGDGVKVIRERDETEAYFARMQSAEIIVQAFVDGPELGVFWLQELGSERGRIFSVTEKVRPTVTGDGERNLDDLIHDDPRAVAMAEAYVKRFTASQLEDVPRSGDEVSLADLGTHCRGAVFLDGREHMTSELEQAVDTLSRGYEGFHFGRYDLRAESWEAFKTGDFKVLELNGVTSEATHIYDPKNSVFAAYRVLFEQWRLCFEIGHANWKAGAPKAGFFALVGALFGYRVPDVHG
ncbi:MAG: alpha/beta fold hydrolase [Acidobacteriota bacterium]